MIYSELDKAKTTQEAIDIVLENNLPPKYGPISFSSGSLCPLSFKKSRIDGEKGAEITRFGTDIGSAMHDLAEIDIQMRLRKEPESWYKVEDIVDRLVQKEPTYEEYMPEMTESLERFRFNFPVSKKYYMASEQRAGCDLAMKWKDYDDETAWFRGRIDYLEVNNKNIARIVDFKNYPSIHSEDAINDDRKGVGCQLMGYGALVMAMFPQIHSFFYEVYYFQFGCIRGSSLENENGDREVRIISRQDVNRWWRYQQRRLLSISRRKEFPALPSQQNCQYCPYATTTCDWAQNRLDGEVLIVNEDGAVKVLNRLKVLEEERVRLKHSLGDFASAHGFVENEKGDKYGYIETEKMKVNTKRVLEACRIAGIDPSPYVNVSPTNAKKLRNVLNGEALEVLESGIITTKETRLKS